MTCPNCRGETHRYIDQVNTEPSTSHIVCSAGCGWIEAAPRAYCMEDGCSHEAIRAGGHCIPHTQLYASRAAAPRVEPREFRPPWLVVIKRETFPVEVTPFETEAEARAFEEYAGRQWSESYVCKVVKGPLT